MMDKYHGTIFLIQRNVRTFLTQYYNIVVARGPRGYDIIYKIKNELQYKYIIRVKQNLIIL